jgi:hypothetical protein
MRPPAERGSRAHSTVVFGPANLLLYKIEDLQSGPGQDRRALLRTGSIFLAAPVEMRPPETTLDQKGTLPDQSNEGAS